MQLRLPLIGQIRLSTLTLTLTLVIALGGLLAIDRALSEHERSEAAVQVVETAAMIDGFLAVHAEALQSVRALHLSGELRHEHFVALLEPMMEYASSFLRVWATDSTGMIQQELALDGEAPVLGGVLVDTLRHLGIDRLVRQARATGRTQISPLGELFHGGEGFLIIEPLFLGDRFLGLAGGSIPEERFIDSVLRQTDGRVHEFVVRAGPDTMAARRFGGVRAFARSASAELVVPGGQRWDVMVTRTVAGPWLRLSVWWVGVVTLGALVVSLLHERRQGQRLAERSSELERLSSELLRANRSKSEFLASVSHELRTPLNAIVGFVDLLRDGVYGELPDRQRPPVERIASSAAHLRVLVDQVLDIAKMAAGRLEVDSEPVDLRPFVLDVATEVESLVSERGLSLSVAVGGALPRIYTDRTHLRQILINLVGNAVKFTREGGIAIRAHAVTAPSRIPSEVDVGNAPPSAEQPWIALQVADTGIGIDGPDQSRIFGEFEQVNAGPRTDSIGRGTGLGLPISRRLARLLGGDVTVASALGKGSTFTLWLPVGADRPGGKGHAPGADEPAGVAAPAATW